MRRRTFLQSAAAAGVAAAGAYVGLGGARPSDAEAETLNLLGEYAQIRFDVPELFAAPPAPPQHSKALVIGSGFGAAVTALRLVQAGIQTTILERGLNWPIDAKRHICTEDEFPDARGFWQRSAFTNLTGLPVKMKSFNGIFDAVDFDNIQVWRGAGVGGGSMVFTGVLIAPEQRFFEHVFGSTLSYQEMASTWYPKARAELRASPMPADVYNSAPFGHSRAWDDASRKAGFTPAPIDGIWNWDVVRSELSGKSRASVIVGRSNLGNSNGAKFDLRQNYLKAAAATGRLTVSFNHAVTDIGVDKASKIWVTFKQTDAYGAVLKTGTITCDRLFLGAGSIGTTELLMRARAIGTLPNVNEHIGRGWGTNGDAALVRSLAFSGGLTQGSASASRIVDESGGNPVSLENWYVPGLPVNLPLVGSLGMVLSDQRADFGYDKARSRLTMTWPKAATQETVDALRRTHNRVAGATVTIPGALPLAKDVNAAFTAHPLGGAVLGKATDSYGRLVGHPRIYVTDAALIPGSAGTANPTLTITALAERNIATTVKD